MLRNYPSSPIGSWPISALIGRTFRALRLAITTAEIGTRFATENARRMAGVFACCGHCAFHFVTKRATCAAMTGTFLSEPVHVVGGGLAGSEAAWQIANAGVRVVLHEMRPI